MTDSWVDVGSSYQPSEIIAAFLYAQMEKAEEITEKRRRIWQQYYQGLKQLQLKGYIDIPVVPRDCSHNGHMFYIKTKGLAERTSLIDYLRKNNVHSVFHYVPLHSSGRVAFQQV